MGYEKDTKRDGWCKRLWSAITKRFNESENQEVDPSQKYQALLPVLDHDQFKKYAEAFETIIAMPVTCVAVTGPYGAGKSSLLNTFIASYPQKKVKRISLATFEKDLSQKESEIASRETSDQIEKSILQQLIYGVGPEDLPYSRFKKIQEPKHLWLKSVCLGLFALSTGLALRYWGAIEAFVNATPLWPWSVAHFAAAIVAIAWLAVGISMIYEGFRLSFGLSLKKLSLKNAEIETGERSNESVFNKHLEELVYFFQKSDLDIILIEDLDRFKNTEIFTKIREINQLINENAAIKKKRNGDPIKFIFAIRDDLFKGKDRTKFFDFIIPVIPYVSSGNAYNVLYTRLEDAGLLGELNKEFLRIVSIHINDNRHLLNTVNEYALYRDNLFPQPASGEELETEDDEEEAKEKFASLDANKLFAMMLYKNFYPNDFEALHNNEGAFAKLLSGFASKQSERQAELEQEQKSVDQSVENHARAILKSFDALAAAYVGMIWKQSANPTSNILINGKKVSYEGRAFLDGLVSAQSIVSMYQNHYHDKQFELAELEGEIHPGITLKEKIAEIELAEAEGSESARAQRVRIRQELQRIRYRSLAQSYTRAEIAAKADAEKLENDQLFVYLVSKGYLGRDFVDYTSYFHPGATTPIDREFIQRFEADAKPDFETRIDNPGEIVTIYNDRLFGKPQGFNLSVVDYVLAKKTEFLPSLVTAFKDHQSSGLQFLNSYYLNGEKPEKLVDALIMGWDGFVDAASRASMPLRHVQAIVGQASDENIDALTKSLRFRKIIGERVSDVFDRPELVEKIPLLAGMDAKFRELKFTQLEEDERSEAIETVVSSRSWSINAQNASAILGWLGVPESEGKANIFSKLGQAENDDIREYVVENIDVFVRDCLFQFEESVGETQESVETLLCLESLDSEWQPEIIERQDAKLRFSEVPQAVWSEVIKHQKYAISWENFEFLAAKTTDGLEAIFIDSEVVQTLASEQQSITDPLFNFLVDFNDMKLEHFQSLVGPHLGSIETLPVNIGSQKKTHLIKSGMIPLNEVSFAWADSPSQLRAALLLQNFEDFMTSLDKWDLTAEEATHVVEADVSNEAKARLLTLHQEADIDAQSKLYVAAAHVLADPTIALEAFSDFFIKSVIALATLKQGVQILTRKVADWSEETVMVALETLEGPHSDIATYRKKPTLSNKEHDRSLAEALKQRGFISSFSTDKKGIKINTKRKPSNE